jgi:hypothetical protein
MPQKKNPLGLNPLQLKTLTLFQALAALPDHATPGPDGTVRITDLPRPHGNHFHLGDGVVAAADATGLGNEAVWVALERKGLVRSLYPMAVILTPDGAGYDTGLGRTLIHRGDH